VIIATVAFGICMNCPDIRQIGVDGWGEIGNNSLLLFSRNQISAKQYCQIASDVNPVLPYL
jgi:hypothetical protein